MRYLILLFLFSLISVFSVGQAGYWQQKVDYTIDVTLHDTDKTLDATETIRYTNNSPDTLYSIPFHLWANAYKNDKTAFSEQLLRNNDTRFYFSDEKERGYIDQLRFTVNGSPAEYESDSSHIDIIQLLLPSPLLPHQTIEIQTPFHLKLPYHFSRSGYEGETFQVAQWYPKPAVYDTEGWHPMPYLDQGEFYSDFGKFDVSVTLPENYIVSASGTLQNEEELNSLKKSGKQPPSQQPNFSVWKNELREKATAQKKPFNEVMPPSSSRFKTLRYVLDSAHDFALFASKLFLVQYDTIRLEHHTVDAFTFYHPWDSARWRRSLSYVKDAVHYYSDRLGEYPYGEVSAVLGDAAKEAGGMEYPTVTLIEMSDSTQELDATIAHEVGHNWLYGVLATNERNHAWMDEGVNTYYENRYIAQRYPPKTTRGFPFDKFPQNPDTLILQTLARWHKDQPIDTRSDSFTVLNYGVIAYGKASMWFNRIENKMGTAAFDSSMQQYYARWKFKHPFPADLLRQLELSGGPTQSESETVLHGTGNFFPPQKRKGKATFLFSEKETSRYNYLSLSPAFGYNYYDKLMIGGLIHNYQLPAQRFQFLAAPLYATASQTLAGAARVSYSTFTKRSRLLFSLSGLKYSINDFTQYDGSKLYFDMYRITPTVQYRWYNADLRSKQRWTFTARTFLIREQQYGEFTTVAVPPDTFYVANKKNVNRYVNELKIAVSDNRKLYPYSALFSINQGSSFLRAGITGNYFFNYAKENEGIQARFFAGKFFYLQQKTSLSKGNNSRYLLTLSGPSGNEDFTYSDYFLGRNEYDGGLSQQIMQRDGFFKVSTPLLNDPVGKTDNWLMALNLSGDIPDEINPLNILPFPLPIKLFVDIGTYSDAWGDDNANGRFLYDAGLQVSILKSAFSIYVPVVYSKVFRDYYKSFYPAKKLSHTISFAFNLSAFEPNHINRNVPL